MRENLDVTIEVPGHPPVHTTTEAIARAAENLAPATRFAKDQLRSIVERVERLEEERKTISDDIRDVYAEAKGNGFDVKALRTIVRLRKQDAGERAEAETILETYMQGVGNAVMDLPQLALSVRQPWAWAIIHAGKDIENRTWQAVNHGLKRRGRIAIHASKGLSKEEYEGSRDFINECLAASPDFGLRCPEAKDLLRGGIIGGVDIVDVVTDSESMWFMGPRGLVLRNALSCEFVPSLGSLGYFEWKPADDSVVPPPAKWMLPKVQKPQAALALQPAKAPGLFDDR